MSVVFRALAAGMILLGATVSAQASVLYDNLAESQNLDSFSNYSSNLIGASFNTDSASNLDLTDVVLLLGDGTSGSSLVVTLHSDSGGVPGGVISGASWTVSNPTFSTTGNYDFHLTSAITLTANTTYWVEGTATGTGSWSYTTNLAAGTPLTGAGAIGNQSYFENGAANNNGSNGAAYQMCAVTGASGTGACSVTSLVATINNSSATPEPATLAILGAGILALGAVRRYRKA